MLAQPTNRAPLAGAPNIGSPPTTDRQWLTASAVLHINERHSLDCAAAATVSYKLVAPVKLRFDEGFEALQTRFPSENRRHIH